MTISFDSVPANIRVPICTSEFNSSRAQQGAALMAYRGLIIGQRMQNGTWTANSLHKVTSADEVATGAGRGSLAHREAITWFKNNAYTELWVGVVDDASAGVVASGTITIAGPATAAGTIDLYIAGEHLQIAVSNADSANTIAAAVAAAIGVHASGTVTMSSAVAGTNVTVAGVTFVGTAGAVVEGAATYSIDTGNPEAATSLAAQVMAHATTKVLVRASANAAVVTLRALAGGTSGNSITLATTDAIKAAVSAATLAGGAEGDNEDLPVFASVNAAVVTLHAKNAGPHGNDVDVRCNYQDGEETPAGVTVTIVEPTSGASAPALTSLITAMGDTQYHVIAHPYTDSTNLGAIETELARRFGPMLQIDGVAVTSAAGSHSTLTALGDTRNSKHSVIWAQPGENPLTEPCQFAAACAANVAFYGNADPGRPFQSLQLKGCVSPAETDLFTVAERNLKLFDGISTSKVVGGAVQMERGITTWQTNAAGGADTSYLNVNALLVLMYYRYSWNALIAARYPRHKVAEDGTRFGSGQAVVTPKLIKAEACSHFRSLEALGLVQGYDQFKSDLVCEVNALDSNRIDVLLSPHLIGQLIVTASKIAFLL